MKRRTLSILLTLAMVLAMLPAFSVTASAAQPEVSYLYPVYNKTDGSNYENAASGISRWEERVCSSYTMLNSENKPVTWGAVDAETWYVAEGTVDYTGEGTTKGGITVEGKVNLILMDDASLIVEGNDGQAGISVTTPNVFTVYAQERGTGSIKATGGVNTYQYQGNPYYLGGAGIGGDYWKSGDNITINGGSITATGGSPYGTGIGGGYSSAGSNIIINGGNVTAKGPNSGAGIGGSLWKNCNNIVINGGTVSASGGYLCPGIGAGGAGGVCTNVAVNGGTVTAVGQGSAIGNGQDTDAHTAPASASAIFISKELHVEAGSSEASKSPVENDGSDIASKIYGLTYISIKKYAAQAGENKYETVSKALEAIGSGTPEQKISGCVILLDDTQENITIGQYQDITLDLNGFVLKGTGSGSVISNNGTLSIKDSNTENQTHYYKVNATGLWELQSAVPLKTDYSFDISSGLKDASGGETVYDAPAAEKLIAVSGGCITGGSAENGGGLHNAANAALNITGCAIIGNIAAGGNGNGGGIANAPSGVVNMTDCALMGNTAVNGGGAMYNAGTINITDCAIICNTSANNQGGGVSNNGIVKNMSNCLISGNSSKFSGGLYNAGSGTMNMTDCIIKNNIAENLAGVYNAGKLTIGGSTVIDSNYIKGGNTYSNLNIKSNALVTLGGGTENNGVARLGSGAEISITLLDSSGTVTVGAVTSNGASDDIQYLSCDNIVYKLKLVPGDTGKESSDPLYKDHIELANYDISVLASTAGGLSLEKDSMTSGQAIAIAKAQMDYTGLSKAAALVYAKSTDFESNNKYSVLTADSTKDWATGSSMTLPEMLADSENRYYFVIGYAGYTVGFDSMGGTSYSTITAIEGTVIDLSAHVPTRDAISTFNGWYANGIKLGSQYTVTENATLTARWIIDNPESASTEGAVIATPYDNNNTETRVAVTGDKGVRSSGLDEVAVSVKSENPGKDVKIIFSAESKSESDMNTANGGSTAETNAIKASVSALNTSNKLSFLDIKLDKLVSGSAVEAITDTGIIIVEAIIPYDLTNKTLTGVYMYHGGKVSEFMLTKSATADSYFYEDGKLHIFTSKFSTYGVSYTENTAPASVSSGGGGTKTYGISIADTAHGSIASDKNNCSAGGKVTLTLAADKGWTLETLTVKDKNGGEISLTPVAYGEKYSFIMPSGAVSVEASFMEDNTVLNYFTDVSADDYFYDAVLWAVENGITSGMDDSHFAPKSETDRAQVITFLWRLAGCPYVNYAMPFTDVPEDAYYAEAVRWGASMGYVKGMTETLFAPKGIITRAQAITLLYRYMGSKASNAVNSFKDVSASKYYYDAVLWALENEITSGISTNEFAPNDNCTRAQVVTTIYRAAH